MSAHTPSSEAWVSWTGGSTPEPLHLLGKQERALVDTLYEAQCSGFRAFWGREPGEDTK